MNYIRITIYTFIMMLAGAQGISAMESNPPLSLLSNDGERCYINVDTVSNLAPLHTRYQALAPNKFLKTNLDASSMRALKDLIDHWHRRCKQPESTIIFELQQLLNGLFGIRALSIAQLTALIKETIDLQLPLITKATAWQLYKTKSEYTKKEFADLGIAQLPECTLRALATEDDRIFLLPEEIATSCPYLKTWYDSTVNELKTNNIVIQEKYSPETITLIKQLIELRYEHKILHNRESTQVQSIIEAHLDKQDHISTDAILLADQWLIPDLAHSICQYILKNSDEPTNKIITALPDDRYAPPFKHNDTEWLVGRELAYAAAVAQAKHDNLFENDAEVAKESIGLIAKNFDRLVKTGAMEHTFNQPHMQRLSEFLKKELLQKKLIHDKIIETSFDSTSIKSLVNLGRDHLLAIPKKPTTAYVINASTGSARSIGDLFENVVAANKFDDQHIITASYKKTDNFTRFLARNHIYGSTNDKYTAYLKLRLWNWNNDCFTGVTEHTEAIFWGAEYPKIKHLCKLDGDRALVQVGHIFLLIWNCKNNTVEKIDLKQILGTSNAKKILPLDANRIAVLYHDGWFEAANRFAESLGILDLQTKKFTHMPDYYDCNAMKTLSSLIRFDNEHFAICAHEYWVGEDGAAHFPTTKLGETATGKTRMISQLEGNRNTLTKKPSFTSLKIDDQRMVSAGVKALLLDRETDTVQQCLLDERGNPSRCAVYLGNGRIAFGMHKGGVRIVTANALLSPQEIIALRKQQLLENT